MVVRVLESTTDTTNYQPGYTHLPSGGEKKKKKPVLVLNFGSQVF
jgi:hypothetical protein